MENESLFDHKHNIIPVFHSLDFNNQAGLHTSLHPKPATQH